MYHKSLFCGLSCLKCFNESQKSFVCRILNRFWGKSRAFFRDNSRIASSYNEKLISTLSGLREIQPHQRTLFTALYPIGKKGGNYPATVSILLPRTSWIAANRNKLWSKLAALRAARLHYLISILKLISRVNRQPRVPPTRYTRTRRGGMPFEGWYKGKRVHAHTGHAFRCGRKSNREKNLALYSYDTRCPTYTNVIYKLCAPTFEYAAHFSSHASD